MPIVYLCAMRRSVSSSLAFAAFLGLETLTGCATSEQPQEKVRAQRESEYVEGVENVQWLPALTLSPLSAAAGRRGNTQQGIQDLQELVKAADGAEAWIEFPQAHLWVDVGGRSTEYDLSDWIAHGESFVLVPGAVKMNYTALSTLLNANKIQFAEARLWHLRPQKTITAVYGAALQAFMQKEVDPQQLEFVLSVTGAFPLSNEFYALLNRANDLRTTGISMHYSEAFCSPAGIVVITPTEDGKDLAASLSQEGLLGQLRKIWQDAAKHIPQLPQYVRNNPQEIESYKKRTVESFCKRLTNKYVTFEYRNY